MIRLSRPVLCADMVERFQMTVCLFFMTYPYMTKCMGACRAKGPSPYTPPYTGDLLSLSPSPHHIHALSREMLKRSALIRFSRQVLCADMVEKFQMVVCLALVTLQNRGVGRRGESERAREARE